MKFCRGYRGMALPRLWSKGRRGGKDHTKVVLIEGDDVDFGIEVI